MKLTSLMLLFVLCCPAIAQDVTPQDVPLVVKKDQARQDVQVTQDNIDQNVDSNIDNMKQDVKFKVENDKQDANITNADARISDLEARMTGDQQFWLKLVGTLGSIITALGIPWIAVMLAQAQRQREAVAKSVNGLSMTTTAAARAEGFFEGAKLATAAHTEPAAKELLYDRAKKMAEGVDVIVGTENLDLGEMMEKK